MSNTVSFKKEHQDRIAPVLTREFDYKSMMQVPVLKKIVINQGLGMTTTDKKITDIAISELSTIIGQKTVVTISKKDISSLKLRKKMSIGVVVTLRCGQMYEFLGRLVRVALPRTHDFKGIESKLDGRGNYTLGIQEQIVFPEISIDNITKILRMNIVFVAPAKADEEGYALLRELGLPSKNGKRGQIVMVRESTRAHEVRRAKLVVKYTAKRTQLKIEGSYEALQALSKSVSSIRLHSRCKITGCPERYARRFDISRIQSREMVSNGLVPGVKKTSWQESF